MGCLVSGGVFVGGEKRHVGKECLTQIKFLSTTVYGLGIHQVPSQAAQLEREFDRILFIAIADSVDLRIEIY